MVAAPPFLREGAPDPACFGQDPNLFFPSDYGLRNWEQIDAARDECIGCPLQPVCLEWALENPGLDGVWAGTTPPERRLIRRERKRLMGNKAA